MMHKHIEIRLILYLCHDVKIDKKGKELQHCILPFYLTMTQGEQILLACQLACILQEEAKACSSQKDAKILPTFICVKFASSQIVRRKTCLLASTSKEKQKLQTYFIQLASCKILYLASLLSLHYFSKTCQPSYFKEKQHLSNCQLVCCKIM